MRVAPDTDLAGYPATGYRISKKAGYPADRISGATLVFIRLYNFNDDITVC